MGSYIHPCTDGAEIWCGGVNRRLLDAKFHLNTDVCTVIILPVIKTKSILLLSAQTR